MSAGPRTDTAADWRPGASLDTLRLRARMLAGIRAFFAARGVLEVETPVLSRAAVPDPAIEPLRSRYTGPGAAHGQVLYLHTSPELAMKRLLAAGSGPVYQLARVFRDAEAGPRHNPEFSLLEWYRPGFDHHALMDEVEALVVTLLPGTAAARRFSYRELFLELAGIDPFTAGVDELAACARAAGLQPSPALAAQARNGWLDLLLTHVIEPRLGAGLVFVYDYPADQAALARVRPGEPPLAERFELYLDGIELANGFHELTDAAEQRARFEADNARRLARGLAPLPVDARFLVALEAGLPACAGVALGFDRLVMAAAGLADIDAALAFSLRRV